MKWLIAFALAASIAAVSSGAEKPAVPAGAAPTEAAAPEPKLDGVVVERTDGTFMTLTMDGPLLVLKFFNKKKQPVTPDVTTGFVRFIFAGRRPEHRALALSSDGKSLIQVRTFHPPYVFKAFISLAHSADDPNPETYTVDYP